MAAAIKFILTNISIIALGLAILIACLGMRKKAGEAVCPWTRLFRWVAYLPAGLIGIYTFVFHMFFQDVAAKAIGWKPSQFENEVAIADLTIGVLGILASLGSTSRGFRKAFTVGATLWLGGDAVNHVVQMIAKGNFSPGNAGPWFWTDVLVPVLLILCMVRMKPQGDGPTCSAGA